LSSTARADNFVTQLMRPDLITDLFEKEETYMGLPLGLSVIAVLVKR